MRPDSLDVYATQRPSGDKRGLHSENGVVTNGSGVRFPSSLRVVVDARRGEWDLMRSIGHERQHAIEVLGSPKVTSTAAMHFFYLRESHSTGDRFETAAAVRAGQDVRSEVRRDAPVPAAR